MGTDWPVESLDPIRGLAAASRPRRPGGGLPFFHTRPQHGEEMTVAEALDAYTRGSALAAGNAHERGGLRPGYLADFAVLSDDPTMMPADEILGRVRVRQTVVGGRTVFREGEV